MILTAAASLSCSLKYDDEVSTDSIIPELEIQDVDYKKYENSKLKVQIKAEKLERYKSDGAAFASRASFYTWDEEMVLKTEGSCSLLGMNDQTEIYTLFDDIFINNIDQKFKIRASSLKWNGKKETLVAAKDDTVYIERDDIQISGTGFSASGVDRSFTFDSNVDGLILTGEDNLSNQADGEQEDKSSE